MERNQAISVAVGVGAVGTALAYLAYSYSTTEDDTANIMENKKENSSWFNNLFENSNTETDEQPKEKTAKQVEKNDSEVAKLPATEQKTTTPWGQFWKNSFDDAKNVKVASEEE